MDLRSNSRSALGLWVCSLLSASASASASTLVSADGSELVDDVGGDGVEEEEEEEEEDGERGAYTTHNAPRLLGQNLFGSLDSSSSTF